jgi:hypothetical protein
MLEYIKALVIQHHNPAFIERKVLNQLRIFEIRRKYEDCLLRYNCSIKFVKVFPLNTLQVYSFTKKPLGDINATAL